MITNAKSAPQRARRSIEARVAVWALVLPILAGSTPRSGATQARALGDSIVHLYKGEGSRAEDPLRTVVRDSASFSRLWDQVVGGPAPRVDFQRYMVIAATMGAQASTLNEIRIVAVDSSEHVLQVRIDLFARECLAGGMITYPADVVRVRRSRRTVTFVERYHTVGCP